MDNEIFVTRSALPPLEEYIEAIRPMWGSRRLTNMGPAHRQLQAALAAFLKVPFLTLFSNGHLALEMTLQCMGLAGEVVTTPFTFVSTTHAIVRAGLTPVFADIDPVTFTLDPAALEAKITPRTCAIVPVHVYGNLCDVQAIGAIAKKRGLPVVYDAAHAFGVEKDGMGAGSFGTASMYSFHATKVFHTIEGGAVACNDGTLRKKLDLAKNFGISGEDRVDAVGGNAKLNEFSAAMGLCNLRHLPEEIKHRALVYGRYGENLAGIPGLRLPEQQPGVSPNYAYYPVVFDPRSFGTDRDAVYAALKAQGIHARRYFSPATNNLACYGDTYDPQDTPVALEASRQVLTLPMYAGLAPADIDRICSVIRHTKR
jgi:dTDP-4-amino-4,6-dideoxygalactose transaminase